MEFFDVLVRYEVTLWSAVDQELGRRGQINLGALHGLRILDRYAGQARVQDLSADIGTTSGQPASSSIGSSGTGWCLGAPILPTGDLS